MREARRAEEGCDLTWVLMGSFRLVFERSHWATIREAWDRPDQSPGPPPAHQQQTDVVGVDVGLVVRVPDDGGDAKHLLCRLRDTQDVSPQHHQARSGVPAGAGGLRARPGPRWPRWPLGLCPEPAIAALPVSIPPQPRRSHLVGQ